MLLEEKTEEQDQEVINTRLAETSLTSYFATGH